MSATATSLAARVAAFGLINEGPLAAEPLSGVGWGALTGRAVQERMEGMLAAAVHDGAVRVTDVQMEELVRLSRSRARADLTLERETLQAAASLQSAGIQFRVLKGPAWAHAVYPDPMMRGFGDVDLLVHPSQWYEALDVLERAGAHRVLPELQPGFDARFGKDATLVSGTGAEIDLHRTLVVGPYGFWIDCEELFSRPPALITVGGASLPVLDPVAAFLHASYNAALTDDPPRLVALRDVAQMATADDLPAEEILRLAEKWRGASVVRRAIDLVRCDLGLDLGRTPLGRLFPSSVPVSDRILLASYRGRARGYTSQLAGVAALPGVRDRVAYVSALIHPQPDYLRARGLGRLGYVGLVARKLGGSR